MQKLAGKGKYTGRWAEKSFLGRSFLRLRLVFHNSAQSAETTSNGLKCLPTDINYPDHVIGKHLQSPPATKIKALPLSLSLFLSLSSTFGILCEIPKFNFKVANVVCHPCWQFFIYLSAPCFIYRPKLLQNGSPERVTSNNISAQSIPNLSSQPSHIPRHINHRCLLAIGFHPEHFGAFLPSSSRRWTENCKVGIRINGGFLSGPLHLVTST